MKALFVSFNPYDSQIEYVAKLFSEQGFYTKIVTNSMDLHQAMKEPWALLAIEKSAYQELSSEVAYVADTHIENNRSGVIIEIGFKDFKTIPRTAYATEPYKSQDWSQWYNFVAMIRRYAIEQGN